MPSLPLMRSLTYKEIYAIYAEGNLGKFSMGYLEQQGWATQGTPNYPLGLDDDGDIVWLPGALGVTNVTEGNSAAIYASLMDGANSAASMIADIKAKTDQMQFTAGALDVKVIP